MFDLKLFFKNTVTKPPLLFPFVAAFHILGLVWILYSVRTAPFLGAEWLQVAYMLVYCICWLGACNLNKKFALGYMAITLLNTILYLSLKGNYNKDIFTSSLFPVDCIFSFFLLFFYKKFQ